MNQDKKCDLIVVSNRLPFTLVKDGEGKLWRKHSAGGLVTAVAPIVVQNKGMWVGWPGQAYTPGLVIPESDPKDESSATGLMSDQIIPVHLSDAEHKLYYNGFCNGTLWPVFHSMPDRAIYIKEHWDAYVDVNQKFAASVVDAIKIWLRDKDHQGSHPVIWIQDYHLILLANMVKHLLVDEGLVGVEPVCSFFLHIPMPSHDILKTIPWENQIINGMLGNDIIGFHIKDYCLNFIECCQRSVNCLVDRERMVVHHQDGRIILVKPLPISIPVDKFERMAKNCQETGFREGVSVILGVDRLDYTKGLLGRLRSFGRFLQEYPGFRGKVVLLQVVVPSRSDVAEYRYLKEDLDKLVGEINGKYSTGKWNPIQYLYGSLPQSELAGFYRDADVALITPLRDGMNLVAKEFVACQVASKGVLILSPFAGAGEDLKEALLVNPYEETNVSVALHRALTMSEAERTSRMDKLRERVRREDIEAWVQKFLATIGDYREMQEVEGQADENGIDKVFEDTLMHTFKKSKLAIFLDYDGTLASIMPHPELVETSPETRRLLYKLSEHPNVFISIVSGRELGDVISRVKVASLNYSGNHGSSVQMADGTSYQHPLPGDSAKELNVLNKKIEDVCKDFGGSWIESKGSSLCVHFRMVEEEQRERFSRRVRDIIHSSENYQATPAHCALECKPKGSANKGTAVNTILEKQFGPGWMKKVGLVFVGDDTTDEDAIKVVNEYKGASFRIANGPDVKTSAKTILQDHKDVTKLLRWIDKIIRAR